MTIEKYVIKEEALPEIDVGSRYSLTFRESLEDELGKHLSERHRKIKDLRDRSDWSAEKAMCFNSYHLVPKTRPIPYPGAANLSCPLPRIGVDAHHANVMASLFTDGTRMSVKSVIIQKDFASTARKASDYLTFVMNHEAEFYMVFDDADKNDAIYGIGYLEPRYVKKEMWETVEITKTITIPPEADPVTGVVTEGKEKRTRSVEKKKVTVFDGVKVDSLPVESVLVSPFFQTLEEASEKDVVFKDFTVSWYELKERSKSSGDSPPFYRNESVEKLKPIMDKKIYSELSQLEQAKASADGMYRDQLEREYVLQCSESHLWWDVDSDGIKEEIAVTFHPETGVILRGSLSKMRIVELKSRPVEGRFYGEGIPKIGYYLFDEWEMFHNTRANAGQWENLPIFFYRAGGRFNPTQITLTPGHGYPVENPAEIVFPQTQRTGGSYFNEENLLTRYYDLMFSLDMFGSAYGKKQTATDKIQMAQKTSISFSNPFNRSVCALNRLLKHIWDLNRECAPDEKQFFVVGEGGVHLFDKMHKYEFAANLQFTPVVQSIYDQQMQRDTFLMAYRLFLVNPMFQVHPEKLWEISQKTLDALKIDIDIPKPPQAKTLSPYEEHELFKQGESPEPVIGEDHEHHLKVHMIQYQSDEFKDWEDDAKERLKIHIDKTKVLGAVLKMANLNQSGKFEGAPGQGQNGKQPPVSSNRNPTKHFNTMKVGENVNSAVKNNGNAANQTNLDQSLNSILGPV